jgi:hypothetical protein
MKYHRHPKRTPSLYRPLYQQWTVEPVTAG